MCLILISWENCKCIHIKHSEHKQSIFITLMVNVGKSSLFHHRITLHILLTLSPKTQVLDHLHPKR